MYAIRSYYAADTKFELDETLFVNLTVPTNATIFDAQGIGTITNDDAEPTISIDDVSITEGGNLVFTVSLTNASYQTITVDYATADDTATLADSDYTQIITGTLTFTPDTLTVITSYSIHYTKLYDYQQMQQSSMLKV